MPNHVILDADLRLDGHALVLAKWNVPADASTETRNRENDSGGLSDSMATIDGSSVPAGALIATFLLVRVTKRAIKRSIESTVTTRTNILLGAVAAGRSPHIVGVNGQAERLVPSEFVVA